MSPYYFSQTGRVYTSYEDGRKYAQDMLNTMHNLMSGKVISKSKTPTHMIDLKYTIINPEIFQDFYDYDYDYDDLKDHSKLMVGRIYSIEAPSYNIEYSAEFKMPTLKFRVVGLINSFKDIPLNIVVMKQVEGPVFKTNSVLTKLDCKKFHLKYEPGLLVFSQDLDWKFVDAHDYKNEKREFNASDFSTYPCSKRDGMIHYVIVSLNDFVWDGHNNIIGNKNMKGFNKPGYDTITIDDMNECMNIRFNGNNVIGIIISPKPGVTLPTGSNIFILISLRELSDMLHGVDRDVYGNWNAYDLFSIKADLNNLRFKAAGHRNANTFNYTEPNNYASIEEFNEDIDMITSELNKTIRGLTESINNITLEINNI
jgi:hypothetical protein